MEDKIEKVIDLNAPVERVWRAITDHEEFGTWFRVKLDDPFVVGEVTRGHITAPGYEHVEWVSTTTALEPERLFAFTWCPSADDLGGEYADKPEMLVEFRLEPTATGTRLVVSESGFASWPDEQRAIEAMRRNEGGWAEQAKNITAHVES